ncbi:MAG: hypothetical protein R3Y49_01940 [Rikenellaceae bacterium]
MRDRVNRVRLAFLLLLVVAALPMVVAVHTLCHDIHSLENHYHCGNDLSVADDELHCFLCDFEFSVYTQSELFRVEIILSQKNIEFNYETINGQATELLDYGCRAPPVVIC